MIRFESRFRQDILKLCKEVKSLGYLHECLPEFHKLNIRSSSSLL